MDEKCDPVFKEKVVNFTYYLMSFVISRINLEIRSSIMRLTYIYLAVSNVS